jgi:hypothetical protein
MTKKLPDVIFIVHDQDFYHWQSPKGAFPITRDSASGAAACLLPSPAFPGGRAAYYAEKPHIPISFRDTTTMIT